MIFEAPVTPQRLRSCPHCGLMQTMPGVPAGMRACCARCGSTLHRRLCACADEIAAGAVASPIESTGM